MTTSFYLRSVCIHLSHDLEYIIQMNYYVRILVLLAIGGSFHNATVYSLFNDQKKGALHGTAGEDRTNQNSTLPKRKILLQEILRVPRYNVSVIYFQVIFAPDPPD